MSKGNPDIANHGQKFSSENQPPPEKKGPKKGSRNRKKLLEAIIGTRLSSENLAIAQLKKEFPEYFEEGKDVTLEEILCLR